MPELHNWRDKEQDLSVADLELKAEIDEGFEILEIGIEDINAVGLAELIIGEENILTVPNDNPNDDLIPVPLKSVNQHTLFRTVRERFPDIPLFKVSSGEKLVLTNTQGSGKGYVLYRHFTGAEIPAKTDDGGSESLNRLQAFNSENDESIPASTTKNVTVDTNLNGRGFARWTYPDKVPAGVRFDLIGIAVTKKRGTSTQITINSIRVWKAQKSILSPDEAFTDVALFPYNNSDGEKPMFLFEKKIPFVTGEDIKIEANVSNADTTAHNAGIRTSLLVHQVPVP